MGQVIFAGEPPYQALNAIGASADAKNKMAMLKFQVTVEEGAIKTVLVRLDPQKALELSRHIVPVVTNTRSH